MNKSTQISLMRAELIIRYWLVERRNRSQLALKVASREWVAKRAEKFRSYLRRHRLGFQQSADTSPKLDESRIAA